MKFKVRDTVRIRNDLVTDTVYCNWAFTDDMEQYRGKIAIIEYVCSCDSCYKLSIDDCCFSWTDDMLEPVSDYTHLLKNGVFGETNNGDIFVIVNDTLVFENGSSEYVGNINENFGYHSFLSIDKDFYITNLFMNCDSFDMYKLKSTEMQQIYCKNTFTEEELRNFFSIEQLKKFYKEEYGYIIEVKE